MFKVFKPRTCLQREDLYKTKPILAVEIIPELKKLGFRIKLVLADSLYGESGDVISLLTELKLNFIVAIRSNHPVWMMPGERLRYNRWRSYTQQLSHRQAETRLIREIIFGKRRSLRYYQITKSNTPDPTGNESWYIMTNLPGNIQLQVAQLYSLRNCIEYGFKQVKNELGWTDYRLTDYSSIERWWEMIFSAYLLVSLHAQDFQLVTQSTRHSQPNKLDFSRFLTRFHWHPMWQSGHRWKSALNNLRLILQPWVFYCSIRPWLEIFPIPGFHRCFRQLIDFMDNFHTKYLFSPSARSLCA